MIWPKLVLFGSSFSWVDILEYTSFMGWPLSVSHHVNDSPSAGLKMIQDPKFNTASCDFFQVPSHINAFRPVSEPVVRLLSKDFCAPSHHGSSC